MQRGKSRRPDFADWVEAYCSGFNAARAGVPHDDAEAFCRRMREDFLKGGAELARRTVEGTLTPEDETRIARLTRL
jgi:hypothetical protein